MKWIFIWSLGFEVKTWLECGCGIENLALAWVRKLCVQVSGCFLTHSDYWKTDEVALIRRSVRGGKGDNTSALKPISCLQHRYARLFWQIHAAGRLSAQRVYTHTIRHVPCTNWPIQAWLYTSKLAEQVSMHRDTVALRGRSVLFNCR